MINKVIESGYVGKYINIGTSQSGFKFASFTLYQKTGKETNQYLPCVVWDSANSKAASNFEQYVKAGNYLLVEGHLTVKKTEDRKSEISLWVDRVIDNVEPVPRDVTPMSKRLPEQKPTFDAIKPQGIEITPDDLPF